MIASWRPFPWIHVTLRIFCARCGVKLQVAGPWTRAGALRMLSRVGWRFDVVGSNDICPACSRTERRE
jgi:hypothetical protein